ncbi:MAG: hypothetical protein WBE13_04870 [Candidatus Acidiferrum sp.]
MPGINDDSVERQELYCHACDRYVQFEIDLALDGNHVLNCPNCNHEHCRVVRGGKITDIRWDQRNGLTYAVSAECVSFTVGSVVTASTSNSMYLYAPTSSNTMYS